MKRGTERRSAGFAVIGRLKRLVRQPIFWFVTAFGNGLVVLGATLFHWTEHGRNPEISGFIDSLYWSMATVTTIGGHIAPVTVLGKVIGIALMMTGALFLWSYMALFVGAIISPDLNRLDREIRGLESDLSEIQRIASHRNDDLR